MPLTPTGEVCQTPAFGGSKGSLGRPGRWAFHNEGPMDWKPCVMRRFFGLAGLVMTGVVAGALPGCKKEDEPTAVVKLPPGIVSLQEEIGKGKAQITATIASLEAVVAAAGSNP